jgi:hypothetical protein
LTVLASASGAIGFNAPYFYPGSFLIALLFHSVAVSANNLSTKSSKTWKNRMLQETRRVLTLVEDEMLHSAQSFWMPALSPG